MHSVKWDGSVYCEQRLAGMAAARCIEFQDGGVCRCGVGLLVRNEWTIIAEPAFRKPRKEKLCSVCGHHPISIKKTHECHSCYNAKYLKALAGKRCVACKTNPQRYVRTGLCGPCTRKERHEKGSHLTLVKGGNHEA